MQKQEINIKAVPGTLSEREFIRIEAGKADPGFKGVSQLNREYLEKTARKILKKGRFNKEYLGFTMVAINNEFWKARYSSTSHKRRLLLLPQCLRNRKKCRGKIDKNGVLLCAECGACVIADIKKESKALGYEFMIAEGSPVVLEKILNNDVDAIFGVACLDSFEKVFSKASRLGIPNVAAPLLRDGCVNTEMDMKEFRKWFLLGDGKGIVSGSYSLLPLARMAYSFFEEKNINRLLPPSVFSKERKDAGNLALQWIKKDGKRLRTIFTLAAYSALKYGLKAFEQGNKITGIFPGAVKKTALAIEVLHKASLVHDDIEDKDTVRYKGKTMNAEYGIPIALNTGDYLVGLGYKMISAERKALGDGTTADILDKISETYLKMSRGQGKELLYREKPLREAGLKEVLDIYRLKTSSAFEIALYCGLRAANKNFKEHSLVSKFSENLGLAFQIFDDINGWNGTKRENANYEIVLKTPNTLNALARRKGLGKRIMKITGSGEKVKKKFEKIKHLYERHGIFDSAERMAKEYKAKALLCANKIKNSALKEAFVLLAGLTFKD